LKSYPSITKDIDKDSYIYIHPKYDGSNIRAEYNSKQKFYKFGTKTQLIDEQSKPFGVAISLIKQKYEEDLVAVFEQYKIKQAVCFFELFGPSSFAGNHDFQENLDVKLIDVNLQNEGLIPISKFMKYFGHLDVPDILYEGHLTDEIIENIRNSSFKGISFEGVICKGAINNKTKMPIMFKIKTKAWLSKLFSYCKEDKSLFNQLC